jgi:hypothetical protein
MTTTAAITITAARTTPAMMITFSFVPDCGNKY